MRDNLEKLEHLTPGVEGKARIDIDNEFHNIIYDCSGESLAKDIINTQILLIKVNKSLK